MTAPPSKRKPRTPNRHEVRSRAAPPLAGTPRAIYDGQERLGSIAPRGAEWVAFENRGQPISVHDSADEAIEAVLSRARAEERAR
jgi:hypothetical protein